MRINFEKEVITYTTLWKEVSIKKFISFSAQGCYHSVILTQTFGELDKNLYEIVIGASNNTESFIRTVIDGDVNTIRAKHEEINMADCSEQRQYWISWNGGVIEVCRVYRRLATAISFH